MSNNGIPRWAMTTAEVPKEDERMRVVVAIDFGTTFSSVAYANTKEPDKQKVLSDWGPGTPTGEKAPTVLRYDNGGTTGPFRWGFGALRPLNQRVHEWFKLGLCPEYEERRATESELGRDYPSLTALPPVKGEEAEKLAVDYLSSLKQRVDEHFAGGDRLVNKVPREYIVTVPAIWDHKEQERTRNCAERAGMGRGSSLQVVSEPEAAAIYALESMDQLSLAVNDTFIICDAGGGTVDLTSYTVLSLNPIKLAGAAKGSGGLCGSSFLNRIFARYLEDKLDGYEGPWDDMWLKHSVDYFEREIKASFTGDDNDHFSIMVHGLPDSRDHGIYGSNLHLTGEELREHVFDKVITRVQALVRDQVANTPNTKAILLAGGFGQSSYLKQQLERLGNVKALRIDVWKIDHSDTAIVRGALMSGLTRQNRVNEGILRVRAPRVESRIAGRSYGTKAYQPFKEDEDDRDRGFYLDYPRAREHLVDRMQWFVKEGDSILDGVPKTFKFQKERVVADGRIEKIEIEIYSCERCDTGGIADPKYPDHAGVKKCATFEVDLAGLEIPVMKYDDSEVYVADLDIEMTLDSASLSFCGVYRDKNGQDRRSTPRLVQFM